MVRTDHRRRKGGPYSTKLLCSLTKEYLHIIWGFQFYYWSVSYLVLGLGALCLALELEKGLLAMLSVIFYPLYAVLGLSVWSFIGTHFEDSV